VRKPSTATGLVRRLGPLDAAAVVISNVIGGGIFFVPVIVAQLVPNPSAILGVWLIGGALAFAGAMAYAELAAVRPQAGGEYVYLRLCRVNPCGGLRYSSRVMKHPELCTATIDPGNLVLKFLRYPAKISAPMNDVNDRLYAIPKSTSMRRNDSWVSPVN